MARATETTLMEPPKIVDSLFAPEIFANEASFFTSAAGVIGITLTSYRFDHSTEPATRRRCVVQRLVLPVAGAQQLALGLYDYLKKQGLDPAPKPPDPAAVQ